MNNYRIISDQIGSGIIGKVHQIQLVQQPYTILIAKIFEEKGEEQYNNEKNILSIISNLNIPNNNYIIKIKNIDITLDFINYFPYNSKYILFDYLQYGNLSKYLSNINQLSDIPEQFTKLICYKLLKGLQILHNNNISHNKIDINNIMFDNTFNPIIIHFSEAFINHDNNYKNDFRGIGKIIAKMMTSGKYMYLKFNKIKKYFEIIDCAKRKIRETDFWNIFKEKIGKDFTNFFDKLLKSKNIINIDELLNDIWLKEIKDIYDNNNSNSLLKIENDLKNDFMDRYKKILFFEQQYKQEYNINSIIDIENNSNYSLINKAIIDNDTRCNETMNDKNYILNLEIRNIYNKPKDFLFDYLEIIINDNNNFNYNKIFYCFINDLEASIKKIENIKNRIDYSDKYLSFNVTFEENIINDYEENNENIESNECNDDIIYEEDDDIENLEIKIELLKYQKYDNEIKDIDNDKNKDNDDNLQQKFYLMFNYIQGNIYDYYHYLDIIKQKAKLILNEKFNK